MCVSPLSKPWMMPQVPVKGSDSRVTCGGGGSEPVPADADGSRGPDHAGAGSNKAVDTAIAASAPKSLVFVRRPVMSSYAAPRGRAPRTYSRAARRRDRARPGVPPRGAAGSVRDAPAPIPSSGRPPSATRASWRPNSVAGSTSADRRARPWRRKAASAVRRASSSTAVQLSAALRRARANVCRATRLRPRPRANASWSSGSAAIRSSSGSAASAATVSLSDSKIA